MGSNINNSIFHYQFNKNSGLFYSYRKTLFIMLPLSYSSLIGAYYYKITGNPTLWENAISIPLTFFWPIWYILLVGIVKKGVDGFDELVQIKQRGNMLSKIFVSSDEYDRFITNIKSKISKQSQIKFAIFWVLVTSVGFIMNVIKGEYVFWGVNIYANRSLYWISLVNQVGFTIVIFSLGTAAYVFYVAMLSIHGIGKYPQQLSIQNLLESSGKSEFPENKSDMNKISFISFYSSVRLIGSYLFDITIRIIFLLIIWGIMMNLAGHPIIIVGFSMILSSIVIMLSFIPQIQIHRVLKSAKISTKDFLKCISEEIKVKLYNNMERGIKTGEINNDIAQIEFLEKQILEIESTNTWTYDFMAVIKLIGSMLISSMVIIYNIVISHLDLSI